MHWAIPGADSIIALRCAGDHVFAAPYFQISGKGIGDTPG
jgi:hypothetical protein